jgi:hypothetical protein
MRLFFGAPDQSGKEACAQEHDRSNADNRPFNGIEFRTIRGGWARRSASAGSPAMSAFPPRFGAAAATGNGLPIRFAHPAMGQFRNLPLVLVPPKVGGKPH